MKGQQTSLHYQELPTLRVEQNVGKDKLLAHGPKVHYLAPEKPPLGFEPPEFVLIRLGSCS